MWMDIRARRCERQKCLPRGERRKKRRVVRIMIVTLLRDGCTFVGYRAVYRRHLLLFHFVVSFFSFSFSPSYFCRRHKAQRFSNARVIVSPENSVLLPLLCRNKIKIGMRRPKFLQIRTNFERKDKQHLVPFPPPIFSHFPIIFTAPIGCGYVCDKFALSFRGCLRVLREGKSRLFGVIKINSKINSGVRDRNAT